MDKLEEVTTKTKPLDALIVCSISMFLTPFMFAAVNIALPEIATDINASAVDIGFSATAYIVAASVSALITGRISDFFGRKHYFCLGMATFTFASFCIIFSKSVAFFTFFRILQGFSSAMISTVGIAILMSVFPQNKRGKAFGVISASIYAGISCGTPVGGIILDVFGWKAIFLSATPLGAFSLFVILTRIKDKWKKTEREPFDFLGCIIYATSIITMSLGTVYIDTKSYAWLLILFGFLTLPVFYIVQCRTKSPLVNMEIFKSNKVFTLGCIITWIHYAVTTSLIMFLTFYLQVALELRPTYVGFILMIQPVIQVTLSVFTGRLADKFLPANIATIGIVITTLAMMLATTLNAQSSTYTTILVQILLGVGFAFFAPTNTLALMNSVEKRFIGIASGVTNAVTTLGLVTCMQALTLTFSVYMKGEPISIQTKDTFLESMFANFLFFTILSLGACILSFLRQKASADSAKNQE